METEETLQALPKHAARHCPVCGARIAEGAKVCLMCGASLEEQALEPGASESNGHPKYRKAIRIIVLAIVAIAILVGSGFLGWNLSQRNVDIAVVQSTFTPTVTRTPTITPSPTRTATPTLTATPQPTPTPIPPQTYNVQAGDTLLDIASTFDTTVDAIKALNGMDSDNIAAGQSLLIPPPTPTPGPTQTPAPPDPNATGAPFLLHTVRTGDTLSTIAERYNTSVADIRAANNIPADSETINVDQVLTIPQYTPTPGPQMVATAVSTPTPVLAFAAPDMLYPPDNATFAGPEAGVILQWASIGILNDREYYKLELILPTINGKETVNVYQRSTAWRVPEDFFPPDTVTDRACSWRVSIVRLVTESGDPTYKVISQTVKRRTFTWNTAQP